MKIIVSTLFYLVFICIGTAGVVFYAVDHGYNSFAELSAVLPSTGKVVMMFVWTAIITAIVLFTGWAIANIKGR